MSAPAGDALLHVVYRVGDLQRTGQFLQLLGLRLLRQRDVPQEKYANAFYGAGTESNAEHVALELTYNYGVPAYNLGTGFCSFGIAVADVAAVVDNMRLAGFQILRGPAAETLHSPEPRPLLAAQVQDPTGYTFELLQKNQRDPFCHISLNVAHLDNTISFYSTLGMTELRRDHFEDGNRVTVTMGYGPENDSTVMKLNHDKRITAYDNGDGYGQIAVRTQDVYEAAKRMDAAGFHPSRAPGPVPGIGTKIVAFRDPSDWKTVLVDAADFEKELE